ncbi:hypothetical protein SLS53_000433 [Cytospora paraplurivora]|uniref:EthD domain-containing protein n=1 Tax=Cytospora paraplurivora TaxID=2898453 RepID=A0AAN9YPK0_9PEZI
MSANTPTHSSPGRLLRLTLAIYRSNKNDAPGGDDFGRDYVVKASAIAARHGIEIYQQCFSPPQYREALDAMNRQNKRGWVIDDHDITIEFYFRTFEELTAVNTDPDFLALQSSEGPYVNLIHTVVSLSWVEKYVDNGKVVNVVDGKSTYPPRSVLVDLGNATLGAVQKKEGL